jgi:hypothetical protein
MRYILQTKEFLEGNHTFAYEQFHSYKRASITTKQMGQDFSVL